MTAPPLSIVVPCYNEEACLTELHGRLSAAARQVTDAYEIVLVNDGSRDRSWEMMQALAVGDPHLVAINLSRNHGHQLALTAGLDLSSGARILIIDADLQDPPELLPEMLAVMDQQGADVVYAVRRARAGETAFKRATAKLFYRGLSRLAEIDIPLDTGDFRLMSRRALDALLSLPEQARFIRGMVAWVGFRQVPIVYDRAERHAGETKYPLSKMVRFAFDAITGFSTAPLRFASHVGLALVGVSVLLLIYIAIAFLAGATIQGWTSLMFVVVVLGAVQMFVLGMIGEYLGRLYIEFEAAAALHRLRYCRPGGGASPPRPCRSRGGDDRGERDSRREWQPPDRIGFGPEDPFEHLVDRRRRQGIVAVLVAGRPSREPRRGRDREEQAVEVGEQFDLQPGLRDGGAEALLGVAALVMVDLVMRAPHPGMGRHGEEDAAVWPEPFGHAYERGPVLLDMLEHIEDGDEVVGLLRHALQLRQSGVAHRMAEALAGNDPSEAVNLGRVDPTETLQHREVVPGAAAHFEDSRLGGERHRALDQPREDVAPRAIPPMGGVQLRHAIIDDALH